MARSALFPGSFDPPTRGHLDLVSRGLALFDSVTVAVAHNIDKPSACWITGFSFGSWIGMQLLMRRPEIKGFITVAPPADKYDFSFLAPCPSSGLIVQGEADEIVEPAASETLAIELQAKRAITIDYELIKGADHFFRGQLDEMNAVVENYLDKRFSE